MKITHRKALVIVQGLILGFIYYIIGMYVVVGVGFGIGKFFGKNVSHKDTFQEFALPWLVALAALLLLSYLIYKFKRFEFILIRTIILESRIIIKVLDKTVSGYR